MKSKNLFLAGIIFLLGVSFFTGCDADSDDSVDSTGITGRIYDMSPAVVPDGVGVDLETESDYSLDSTSIPSTWHYDIKIQTVKGLKPDGVTMKGAPHIKLYKTDGKAYKYGYTGKDEYLDITSDDIDTSLFASDLVEENDYSSCMDDTYTTKINYNKLIAYYQANLLTNDSSEWLPSTWVVGEDEVIYIIKTEEGNYYKLIVLGMGPESTGSGSCPGSGKLEIAFDELK